MTGLMRFTKKLDRQMIDFITSFISADIAIMLVQSMVAWTIFERLGISFVTALSLFMLLVSSVLTRKFSYLLDKYSRTGAVMISNALMMTLVALMLITDWIGFYVLLSVSTSLYFGVFYPARSAVAQAMMINNKANVESSKNDMSHHMLSFKQLNSILVVTDKMGAISVSVTVASLFVLLGTKWLIALGLVILILSTFLLHKFGEPIVVSSADNNTNIDNADNTVLNDTVTSSTENDGAINNKTDKPSDIIACINTKTVSANRDFVWYFSHPISWLSTLSLFIMLSIMLSNNIDTVYLYDILKLTPEIIAYTGIAYSSASIVGGLLVNLMQSKRKVIYICFTGTLITSFFMPFFPIFITFVISSAVFGFIASTAKVMISSLIMEELPNDEVATFEGLTSSLRQGLQFLGLLGINLVLFVDMPRAVIWFYPGIFLLLPLVWLFMKRAEHSIKHSKLEVAI